MNALPQVQKVVQQATLEVIYLNVDESSAGQRIDNFLLKLAKGVPKSHVYRILRSGEVRVNKGRVDPTYRLQLDDVVRIPPLRIASKHTNAPVPLSLFSILHEDNDLLIIDKPAGIAVHGGSGVSHGVIEQLRRMRPEAKFLELVHRLDRETSGILMLAKKRAALLGLHEQLRRGEMDKRYLACVRGEWQALRQHIKFPLFKYHTAAGERRVRVQADGQPAHTIVTRLQTMPGFSLLEAQLKTGRTHQIRVHLAHSGFPIVGDDKYGEFSFNRELAKKGFNSPVLRRMFLHACRLTFLHPSYGTMMTIESNLPPECELFLQQIQNNRAPTSL